MAFLTIHIAQKCFIDKCDYCCMKTNYCLSWVISFINFKKSLVGITLSAMAIQSKSNFTNNPIYILPLTVCSACCPKHKSYQTHLRFHFHL